MPAAAPSLAPAPASTARLTSIDATRAVVMIVMTLDHASSAFNAGRLSADGAGLVRPGPVEGLQFAARWITHVCAPAFFLLAGMGIALAAARRLRGSGAPSLDRDLLARGVLLVLLEVVWMSWAWQLSLARVVLGVLYALGGAMILMVGLRRLPATGVLAVAIALLAGGELIADALAAAVGRDHLLLAATLTGARHEHLVILYPVLPWLGFMALGYVLGLRVAGGGLASARSWLGLAAVATLVFVAVRGANAYGNFDLLRAGASVGSPVIDWLRTSKYPPSLAFAACELALVFLLLAAWTRWQARPALLVLGRTALVFYLLHVHLLKLTAFALGVHRGCGLGVTAFTWLAALAVLYPVCVAYDRVKRRHPRSVLRFL